MAATKKEDGRPGRVLCTYRKVTVEQTDRDFHEALYGLRDKLYYEMNCIHSQNPVADRVQEVRGPEEVAVSVVAGDGRMPRSFIWMSPSTALSMAQDCGRRFRRKRPFFYHAPGLRPDAPE